MLNRPRIAALSPPARLYLAGVLLLSATALGLGLCAPPPEPESLADAELERAYEPAAGPPPARPSLIDALRRGRGAE